MSYTPLHGFASTSNNSTALLAGAATFTGTAEQNNVPDVMCSCHSDVAGTLYFDFSNDSVTWHAFPTNGFTVSAGIHEFHVARKGPRYFRVRYINGAAAQASFELYTYFGWYGQGMAPINFDISADADAIVTKSVISGIGDTTATVTDHQALQVTPPPEGKTAFGEASIAELTPIVQMQFPYDYVDDSILEARPNQSGTVSAANSLLTVTTGAAANSSGMVRTLELIQYRAGEGFMARFTGIFTTGVAGSSQTIGIGDQAEALAFGYDGTAFGILHRRGGVFEIRTLTVTTASSTAENITITLDGDAHATVAVTASANITTTANEIAAADYSDIGLGWKAVAKGPDVVFTSWTSGSKTGTYSLSSATTAVGTFAQTLAGVASTDTWIPQASWNGLDKFDGTGLTGITLDPTKLNVFQIKFQYLGAGAIFCFIEDSDDGEMHLVHLIDYANQNTVPSLDNPSLPMFMEARNVANTSDLSLSTASIGAFVEGKLVLTGARHGIEESITLGATAAETPITTIRSTEVFQSKMNRTKTKILLAGVSAEHSKPVGIKFYANATLTDASFASIDTNSTIEQDSSATALSGGVYLFTIELGKTGNQIVDLKESFLDGNISPGQSLTATIAPKSGNAAEASVSLYFVELV